MTAAIERVQLGLGIGRTFAIATIVALFGAIGAGLAVSSHWNLGVSVLGVAVIGVAVLVSLRWPLLPLFAFVMLVPIEEAVVLGGFGTLSRYMEILFIVAYGLPRLGRLTISAMPVAGWGYAAWAVLSLLWAIDQGSTLQEIPIFLLLFTMAILVASLVVERPAIVRPILWAYTISAGITAIIGIVEYGQGTLVAADRVAALEGQDPAHYAALLLPALVFSVFEVLRGGQVPFAAAIASVCTAGIIVSGTRGAWVSAAVVAIIYVVPRLAPAGRVMAAVFAIVLVGLAFQLPGVGALVQDRADSAVTSGGAGRTDIWSVGLLIYESAPVTGVGLADFSTAYTPERIRESDVRILAPWRPAYRAPHNLIIGTLGELGTIGLILLLAFLLPLLVRTGWGPDAPVVQAALASLVVMAQFLDLLNRKEIWLFVGLMCGLIWLARHVAVPDPARPEPRWRRAGSRMVSGTLVGILHVLPKSLLPGGAILREADSTGLRQG